MVEIRANRQTEEWREEKHNPPAPAGHPWIDIVMYYLIVLMIVNSTVFTVFQWENTLDRIGGVPYPTRTAK